MLYPCIRQEIQSLRLVTRTLDTRAAPIYNAAMKTTEHSLDKNEIRQRALIQRKTFSPHDAATSSQAITERVLALPIFTQARCLHIYVSGKDNELDTLPLIEYSLQLGKEVAVPIIDRTTEIPKPRTEVKTHAMAHALIHNLDELAGEYWGIRQPNPRAAHWLRSWNRIDLVIVPGISFDRHGHRIGYGAGYYDRFLANLRALRVGLCYDALLCEKIPSQDHDIDMDLVITETTTYKGAMP